MAVPSGKSDRIDAALAEYLRRKDAGQPIDRVAFLAANPDIADDLAAFLDNDESVGKAIHTDKTVDFGNTPTPNRSRGLQIRCPHCSNQVELLVDTPYEEITCHSCGSTFSLVEREEPTRMASPLRSIGRFDLISRLGIGGFGSVWKARDRELDRIVAVKIPRKGQLAAAELEQFFREARAAAQLRHPNIVQVHEVGREGETIFIVCDLIRGVELSDWLSANRPSFRETTELCQKVARALHFAHQAGIIHRDLKPSNIMIDPEGEPHLMDFGLAKREVGEITMTVEGQILGTPAYMSPEQAAGRSHWTDRRTDVYSLGVILYRMLSGELPFRGNAQMQVYQRLTDDPPSPRTLNRHVPRDLETICLKCLERDPNSRYSSTQELAEELRRYVDGEPIRSRPISHVARLVRWTKRKPWLAATIALGAILAVAGPTTALRLRSQNQKLELDAREYTDLIARRNEEVADLSGRNADQRRQLDLWEGKTNPWTFWPPDPDHPLRERLLHDLDQRRSPAIARQLAAGAWTDWQASCGHLALAILAQRNARHDDAADHFRASETLLARLVQQNAAEPAYIAALARVNEGLAALSADNRGDESLRRRREAMRLYDQLTELAGADAMKYRIGALDLGWNAAIDEGFDRGPEGKGIFDDAMRRQEQLIDHWPTNPVEVYRLVCFLAREESALPAASAPTDDKDAAN